MRLRIATKLLLSLVAMFATLTVVNYGIQQFVVMRQFTALEEDAARADLRRCRDAIRRELENNSLMARDWSVWDDPYQYMNDHNPQFEVSNLTENSWETSGFHLLYFVDTEGQVVWGQIRDPQLEPLTLPGFPADRFPTDHPLLAHKLPLEGDPQISGTLMTDHGPMLVSARPILPSDRSGPARGTLIMGRFLTPDRMEALRQQICVKFNVYGATAGGTPATAAALAGLRTPDDLLLDAPDEERNLGYAYLADPQGVPALVIEADIPRSITAQGRTVMRLTLLFMVVAALLTCVLFNIALRVIVSRPLERLTARVIRIGQTGDLTQRMRLDRADEIGQLASEFNTMVGHLAEARAKLLETSRDAGMADVASGVLHNVGNVLNNVNVSTSTLMDSVKRSKVSGLARAAELLDQNRGNIAEFISQDEHGRHLPQYLRELAQVLAEEQQLILGELRTLKTSVDHVNQVVQSQHRFAKKVGHVEPTNLRELVNDALAIMEAGFRRHGVQWHSDLADIPTIQLDAAKCMQVLVNLLTNAKEAIGALPKGEKRVEVRLRPVTGNAVGIDVLDNGMGISPENMTRIFANGFTTKPAGRGFGLHYCALAARELGGELTVHSAGPGRGACFTLRLPLNVVEHASVS